MSSQNIELESTATTSESTQQARLVERVSNKVIAMMRLQDSMNKKVHEDWVAQRFEWYRAAWIECGELMDHLGYKWWKKQEAEVEQVKLEIIDIWHFAMSSYFTASTDDEKQFLATCEGVSTAIVQASELARSSFQFDINSEQWSAAQKNAIRIATEAVAEASLAQKTVPVAEFWQLLSAAGLDLDSLYTAYIGKNVLNRFRQDHGYKSGTYQKTWHGREDNEHLAELVDALDADAPDFQDKVYQGLASIYAGL